MSDEPKPKTLENVGTYLMFESFTPESAKKVVDWILTANINNHINKLDHLHLVINSPGGNACALFSIIDTMFGSKIPIHTTGLGMIASCGFMCFIAGEKGHRVLTPNTSILSHQYAWGGFGKHHELLGDRVEQDHTYERMMNLYKRCLPNLTEDIIKEKLLPPTDVWLSAEDCLELGVCDSIFDGRQHIYNEEPKKKKKKK